MTERQKEKIKDKIKQCKSQLRAEKRKFGGYYDDSYGLRYSIAELYLQLGDSKATKRYYKWFDKEFSDDIAYPYFTFGWIKTLFENADYADAKRKIAALDYQNTYLLDLILGRTVEKMDKSEHLGFESLEYALENYKDCQKLLTEVFRNWLIDLVETEDYKSMKNSLIEIQQLLKNQSGPEQRGKLLDAKRALVKAWKAKKF